MTITCCRCIRLRRDDEGSRCYVPASAWILKGQVERKTHGESMTPAEKQRFHGYFPSLDVNRAVVTGEYSNAYNCISWTVGITNAFIWPGSSIAAFDTFYRRFGYARSADGPIAVWGNRLSMTHGCVSGPSHGPR